MLALGLLVDLLTNAPLRSIMILVIIGVVSCGIVTVMTYKNWLPQYVMYFIPIFFTVLTIVLVMDDPVITTYFLVFVTLSIMTFYNNFRAIAFATLLELGLTVYLFLSEYKVMFENHFPITIFLFFLLIAAPFWHR